MPRSDTGNAPEDVEYKETVHDMDFTPVETKVRDWNFTSGRWGGINYQAKAGYIADSGDPDHGNAFYINYGDWAGYNCSDLVHNAMFSFDFKQEKVPNDKGGSHFAVCARLFGVSYYGMRVDPEKIYLTRVGLDAKTDTVFEYKFPAGFDVTEWHNYGFRVNRDLLEFFVDGERVGYYIDKDPLYYEHFSNEFRLESRYIKGWIDNVKVLPLDNSGKPVYPDEPIVPEEPDDNDNGNQGGNNQGGNNDQGGNNNQSGNGSNTNLSNNGQNNNTNNTDNNGGDGNNQNPDNNNGTGDDGGDSDDDSEEDVSTEPEESAAATWLILIAILVAVLGIGTVILVLSRKSKKE